MFEFHFLRAKAATDFSAS